MTRVRHKAGDVITLRGKTQKGKNRVREHGDTWLVRDVDHSVMSPNLGLLVCPASYIGTERMIAGTLSQRDGYCRWVRVAGTGDPDFEIVRE